MRFGGVVPIDTATDAVQLFAVLHECFWNSAMVGIVQDDAPAEGHPRPNTVAYIADVSPIKDFELRLPLPVRMKLQGQRLKVTEVV